MAKEGDIPHRVYGGSKLIPRTWPEQQLEAMQPGVINLSAVWARQRKRDN